MRGGSTLHTLGSKRALRLTAVLNRVNHFSLTKCWKLTEGRITEVEEAIGKSLGLRKCAMVHVKAGRVSREEDVRLRDGESIWLAMGILAARGWSRKKLRKPSGKSVSKGWGDIETCFQLGPWVSVLSKLLTQPCPQNILRSLRVGECSNSKPPPTCLMLCVCCASADPAWHNIEQLQWEGEGYWLAGCKELQWGPCTRDGMTGYCTNCLPHDTPYKLYFLPTTTKWWYHLQNPYRL